VVSEDGIERLAFEGLEDAGALPGGSAGKLLRTRPEILLPTDRGRDEIPGEKNGIGLDTVDAVNDMVKEERLSVVIHVDVAELDDAHAIKGRGQIAQIKVALRYLDPMAFDLARIERQSGSTAQASFEEAAPGDGPVGRGER